MKRTWIFTTLLAWLAVAAVISINAFKTLNDWGNDSTSFHQTSVARLDGMPALTLQRVRDSLIESPEAPAWTQFDFYMVPDTQQQFDRRDANQYWHAASIDKPFHLTFRKQDGSSTGPHRVDFDAGIAQWAADGMSLQFFSGNSRFLNRPFRPENRVWHFPTARPFIVWPLCNVFLAGAAIGIVSYVAWRVRHLRRTGKNTCASCGYDLRGTAGVGVCPECGAAVPLTSSA